MAGFLTPRPSCYDILLYNSKKGLSLSHTHSPSPLSYLTQRKRRRSGTPGWLAFLPSSSPSLHTEQSCWRILDAFHPSARAKKRRREKRKPKPKEKIYGWIYPLRCDRLTHSLSHSRLLCRLLTCCQKQFVRLCIFLQLVRLFQSRSQSSSPSLSLSLSLFLFLFLSLLSLPLSLSFCFSLPSCDILQFFFHLAAAATSNQQTRPGQCETCRKRESKREEEKNEKL